MNFFFKIQTGFAASALFHDQVFFCTSSLGVMNVSLTIIVVFESRRVRKNFS